jgi:putative SOS response-associated peptidase YedK
MCGRFNLRANAAEVAEVLGIADPAKLPPVSPRFNIALTQSVLTAARNAKGKSLRNS